MENEKVRAAYRATLVAALKEAQERNDQKAQDRIRRMLDEHDGESRAEPQLENRAKKSGS